MSRPRRKVRYWIAVGDLVWSPRLRKWGTLQELLPLKVGILGSHQGFHTRNRAFKAAEFWAEKGMFVWLTKSSRRKGKKKGKLTHWEWNSENE